MALKKGKFYYISATDAVLRATPQKTSKPNNAINHLIYGDYLKYLGEEKNGWAKVRTRGWHKIYYYLKTDKKERIDGTDDGPEALFDLVKQKKVHTVESWGNKGWLKTSEFDEPRVLEVNFVDVGQGDGCHIVTPDDRIILIDAGVGDNMSRYLNWRYNLRHRKVAGIEGVSANSTVKPMPIDICVISHPDKDHYNGFRHVFANPKVKIERVYHNGAVERPIKTEDKEADLKYSDDLGGYFKEGKKSYLYDVVHTDAELKALLKKHKGTRKLYLPVLQAAHDNNGQVKFASLGKNNGWLEGFEEDKDLRLKLLGPITEKIKRANKTRECLLKLGDEGVTKNGHSVIIQLQIGKLRVMLGGDLNTEAEDHLLQHYAETETETSELERRIYELEAKGIAVTLEEKQELEIKTKEREAIIAKARPVFEADISKACHHGSHHFSESFIRVLNSAAVVISSGNEENYAHPRPDALGSFGKYCRGVRPLIFSTELARNTHEFTPIIKYLQKLEDYQKRIAAAATKKEKDKLRKEMQEEKDRNVAVYGMITLRTNGERVVIAQKLEQPGGNDNKWDIHELKFNDNTGRFEYQIKTGH